MNNAEDTMTAKAAVAIAITVFILLSSACDRRQEASTEKPPIVKGVVVGKLAFYAVDEFYEATGTVRSRTTTTLSSRTMGAVVAISAREGQRVRAGQVIVEIDDREARAQAQRAKAGLNEAMNVAEEADRHIRAAEAAGSSAEAAGKLARATNDRYRLLLERKSVSPQEYDEVHARRQMAEAEADRADKMLQAAVARKNQVLARIDQAKSEIANAEALVSYTRIVSPINGVITARHTEVGSTASPGVPLVTVEDASRYRLEVAAGESELGKLRLGDRAQVVIDALGVEPLSGVVAEIVPAADPASRSFMVKIELPANPALRSGLYGKARFVLGQRQALCVSRQAVVERGQMTGVMAVDEQGVAHFRLIKTGKSFGDRVEVLSGLNEGERIVIDGLRAATDGARVQ
jgi:multidrug efflux pump subunit AcrA (membrane-fusion protein)